MYHNQPAPPSYSYGHGGYSPYGQGVNSYNSYSNNSSPSHARQPPPSASTTGVTHTSSSNSLMSRMDETSAFSLLQHLSSDDLKHLLEDDSKLQDLINDLAQVKRVQEDHDSIVVSNKSIAEYNLSLKPRLEELKQTVASGYEKQNGLKNSLAMDKAQLDTFVNHQSLDTLHALLQTETAKVEEESENLTSEFFENVVNMDDFVSAFISKRTTMHLRRIKCERMAELIRVGPSGQAPTPAPRSTISSSHFQHAGGVSAHAPYPTTFSSSMPQPRLPYQ